MGNIQEVIKSIIGNKNTLTILLVFAGIIGLYIVYNNAVNEAIKEETVIYAKKEISSRTKISDDMISTVQIPKSLINNSSNLIKKSGSVVGKTVKDYMTIPAGSFFYTDCISTDNKEPAHEFDNIPDGYTVYTLLVDFDTTYANSMYPGNRIDLFVKAVSDNKIIFGRLIKGIQILYVDDSSGKDVFGSISESRKPKYMIFAVPNDLFELLKKAENVPGLDILPIPRNESYSTGERTAEIDSTWLQTYILKEFATIGN